MIRNKPFIILIFFVFVLISNCATHTFELNNYQVPVSLGNEEVRGEKARFFKIKKKLVFVVFDLVKLNDIDLSNTLRYELPNAKKIYNLKIETEEDIVDSMIRTVGTGIQYLLASNRSLVSRRTVIITGIVVE
jgi:hypothetical protein